VKFFTPTGCTVAEQIRPLVQLIAPSALETPDRMTGQNSAQESVVICTSFLQRALTCPKRRGAVVKKIINEVVSTEKSSDRRAKRRQELARSLKNKSVALSKRGDSTAAASWSALHAHCRILEVDFVKLVDLSVIQVLKAEDWESVKFLWEVLPEAIYSEEKAARKDEGLVSIKGRTVTGPVLLLHNTEKSEFFTGHLADNKYVSGGICKIK
jgi:hypothetical protein